MSSNSNTSDHRPTRNVARPWLLTILIIFTATMGYYTLFTEPRISTTALTTDVGGSTDMEPNVLSAIGKSNDRHNHGGDSVDRHPHQNAAAQQMGMGERERRILLGEAEKDQSKMSGTEASSATSDASPPSLKKVIAPPSVGGFNALARMMKRRPRTEFDRKQALEKNKAADVRAIMEVVSPELTRGLLMRTAAAFTNESHSESTLGTCPKGTKDDAFRSALKQVSGYPPHSYCGVVIANLCLKNSRPLVFVDEFVENIFPSNSAPALEEDERALLEGAKKKKEAMNSGSEFAEPLVLSKFQLLPQGIVSLCNEGIKSKPRFAMKEYDPRSYLSVVVPTLKLHREEWARNGLLPELPPLVRSALVKDGQSGASGDDVHYGACDNKVLVAPFCWELYGYHLFLCLMAMHSHLSNLGLIANAGEAQSSLVNQNGIAPNPSATGDGAFSPKFIIAISKASKQFPYMTGSSTSWHDSERANNNKQLFPSRTHGSRYWRLWQVLADSPADVFPDVDVPSQCFRLAVIGAPASYLVTPQEAQRFRIAMVQRLGLRVWRLKGRGKEASLSSSPATVVPPLILNNSASPLVMPTASAGENNEDTVGVISSSDVKTLGAIGSLIACRQYRIVIIEREKQYQITNLDVLSRQIACVFSGGRFMFSNSERGGSERMTSSTTGHCEYPENSDANTGGHRQRVNRLFSIRIAVLERLSLEEQLALAVNTDLFVAIHGNGLTWSSLMPIGGAMIELWPNYVYNGNYAKFAERSQLFRATVEAKNSACRHRCPMHFTIPDDVFASVIRHLDGVSCREN